MRRRMIATALSAMTAAGGTAQMPTADERMQRVHQQYEQGMAGCERSYRQKIDEIENPTRRHIPAARSLAEEQLRRCRDRIQGQFERLGRLRDQPR